MEAKSEPLGLCTHKQGDKDIQRVKRTTHMHTVHAPTTLNSCILHRFEPPTKKHTRLCVFWGFYREIVTFFFKEEFDFFFKVQL